MAHSENHCPMAEDLSVWRPALLLGTNVYYSRCTQGDTQAPPGEPSVSQHPSLRPFPGGHGLFIDLNSPQGRVQHGGGAPEQLAG